MKTLIFFCFSLLFLAGCGSSGGSSSSTSTGTCTYSNGYYYVSGSTQAYSSCPSGTTLATTGSCTYSNGLYYYNGVPYSTCPATTATSAYGTGVHNCANLTLMDSYGTVGVCTINYNYCAGYTMYSTTGGGAIYCQ